MKTSFFGWLCAVMAITACSSGSNDASRIAAKRSDGGSRDGSTHPTPGSPDSSSSHPDGQPTVEGGRFAEGGAAPEGSVCGEHSGPQPDFFVGLSDDVHYEGPVTVAMADAGTQLLEGYADGGRVEARYGGGGPALPSGTTLWASLYRSTFHPNPVNSTVTSSTTLRESEHGPVLAATLHTFVTSGSPTTFLGVSTSASQLCVHNDITNIATNESCLKRFFYSVTIHGDSDLTLTPVSEGHVKVGGIEYVVWLSAASSETMDFTSQMPCVQDWAPYPGLTLSARAVRYEDIVSPGPRDG